MKPPSKNLLQVQYSTVLVLGKGTSDGFKNIRAESRNVDEGTASCIKLLATLRLARDRRLWDPEKRKASQPRPAGKQSFEGRVGEK